MALTLTNAAMLAELPAIATEQAELRTAQVTAFRRLLPLIGVVYLVNATLVAAVFFSRVETWLLAAWLAAIWFLAFQCLASWYRHRHRPPATDIRPEHLSRIERTAWLSGVLWGAAGLLFFESGSLPHQVFLMFVLGGMAAGATAGLSFAPALWLGYIPPALGPLVARFAIEGGQIDLAMAAMGAVYAAALTFLGHASYRAFRATLIGRLQVTAIAAQLDRSRGKLTDAIESIPDGFVLYDDDDRFVLCNQRYREIHHHIRDLFTPGRPFAEIAREGTRRLAVAQGGSPDEAAAWIKIRLERHRAGGEPLELQVWGTDRWMRIAERKTADGGLVGVHTDITERKKAEAAIRESEQRIRDVARNLPGVMFRRVLKLDGKVEFDYLSREVYGQDPAQFLGGAGSPRFFDHFHPDDRAAYFAAANKSAETLTPMEVGYRWLKDGQTRWVRSRATPRRMPNGDVVWDGVALDETDRVLAEERIRAHEAEIAHLLRLNTMGEMAAALAHQLNQPLNAVANYTRGVLRRMRGGDTGSKELIQALELAGTQAERAAETVRGIADFTRKTDRKIVDANLNAIIRAAVDLAKGELDQSRVKLDLDLAADLPALKAVPIELEQAILNLIRNAIEAMSEINPLDRRIVIRTAPIGNEIAVAVRDRGPGFKPEQREQMFDAFYSTKRGNMGMGLSISRTIVEAHGGTLRAHNNDDGGATFEVKLPGDGGVFGRAR